MIELRWFFMGLSWHLIGLIKMPKYISPEIDRQILELSAQGMPNTEVSKRCNVSVEYIRQLKLKQMNQEKREETSIQAYETFGEREKLKFNIKDAFNGVEHMMLQCAARDLCSEKSRVGMSLTKTPNGLTLEFSFDDPKSLAQQGWVETWTPSNELHLFLINSYLAGRWKSKYELLERMKCEALDLIEGTDLKEAGEIAQRFQAEAWREFDNLKRELKSSVLH